MDTSKEYILMCEKAKEIQALKYYSDYLKPNQILYFENSVWVGFPFPAGTHLIKEITDSKNVWLPRPNQLQEMLESNKYAWYTGRKDSYFVSLCHAMIWDFSSFIQSSKLKTMEQLWLAFVMKEKFNKIWKGKDWIKE